MAGFIFVLYFGLNFMSLVFTDPLLDNTNETCTADTTRCGDGFGGFESCCKGSACQFTNRIDKRKRVYICCKRWYHWDEYEDEWVYPTCRFGHQRDAHGCILTTCNSKLQNLAIGQIKRTRQSSLNVARKHLSKYAVDGNLDTFFSTQLKDKVHWWRLYLGEVSLIFRVVIHSVDLQPDDGILNGKVNVEDSEFRMKDTCAYVYKSYSIQLAAHRMYNVRCSRALTGDYVRIYRRHSLRMREIEVWGYFS